MLRNARSLFSALLAVMALVPPCSGAPANGGSTSKSFDKLFTAPDDALQLNQSHFFMGGEKVILSPRGIRIENTGNLKYVLISKAPDWRVYVYRMDDKTYFSQSLHDFEQNGLMSNFCFPFRDLMFPTRCGHEMVNVNGFPVIQLTTKSDKMQYMEIPAIPEGPRRILFVAYKVSTNKGIPVQYWCRVDGPDLVTGMSRARDLEKRLDTTTIKQVKIPATEFDLPAGLTAIGSMREVVAGNNTRNRDDDIKALLRM